MTFSIQMPGFEIEKKEQKCDYEIEPTLNGRAQIEAWVKFSFSKKATKFETISHMIWR